MSEAEPETKRESRVTYEEVPTQGPIRVIRGLIDITSDPDFIIVRRRDGVVRIARRCVVSINSEGD